MVTDVGICWALNSDHMRDVYKRSPGVETFLENIGQEGDEHKSNEVKNIPGVGGNYSFRLNLAMRGVQ